ncbi:MAG: type II toxin-antitoxin system PemK/MazF family toxin [Nostocoides sp.]
MAQATDGILARAWEALQRIRRRRAAPEPRRLSARGATGSRYGGAGEGGSIEAAPYPGDLDHPPEMMYAPKPDGRPDPGEIVWSWVAYEEDATQGKDRPVLLIGWDGPWLVGLQLTSKDHARDAEQERAAGREWVDIGSGSWDRRHRPSEVRVNRILRIDPNGIRREGAVLDRDIFLRVARAARAGRGD